MAKLKFISPAGNRIAGNAGQVIYERYLMQAGQVLVHTVASFAVGAHQLTVYRSGKFQEVGVHYLEIDSNLIQFFDPMVDGDSVVLTIQGIYTERLHEEHTPAIGETVVHLSGKYHKDLMTLLVFRNGILQQRGVDYTETDASTITLTRPCKQGELLTFYEQV